MKLFGKDLSREVAIVAEIGVNHEGSLEAALRLMRLACESGADAVKFQTYTPARYASASDPERLARVARFALNERAFHRIAREAEKLGTPVFSTPLSEDVVGLVATFSPAIKIASGDLTFEPVIRAAAATGKPVILSTGLGTLAEIKQALGWVKEEIGSAALAERVVVMHCVSAYPTPVEQANLLSIPFLADRLQIPVGYSNHVPEVESCLAAVALGACVVEVHFTDSRSGRTFRDHELSLEPGGLAYLVDKAPRVCAMRGTYSKEPQACERDGSNALRKGVVAARDLTSGAVLAREDLMFARPAGDFPAHERDALIGRKLRTGLARGELVRRDSLAD